MHEKRRLFFNINEFEKEGKIEKKNVSFLLNINEEKIAIIDESMKLNLKNKILK